MQENMGTAVADNKCATRTWDELGVAKGKQQKQEPVTFKILTKT